MLGSAIALALVEATPSGRKLKNQVVGFYREVNQKLKSGDYMYGNTVQLSRFGDQLGKFRNGDPLSPMGDDEVSLDAHRVVGAYVQEARLLFNVAKRRVKSVIRDDAVVERLVEWYAPASFTVAVEYDPGNPASKLLARLGAMYPARLDILFSFGLLYNTYKNEAKVIQPVLAEVTAVTRLSSKLKGFLSKFFDVELRKFRLSFGDRDYIHPVFYAKPKEEAVEAVDGNNLSFSGLPQSADGLGKHPDIRKLYRALSDYSLGTEVEDEEKISRIVTGGREAEIPEHFEKLADEILDSLGRAK